MSLIYYTRNKKFGSSIIWNIEEHKAFFLDGLGLSDRNLPDLKENRVMEWLATRYLAYRLEHLIPEDIYKDKFGKPHSQSSNINLSISHSKNLAAFASFHQPIGIDVQIHSEKIRKIAKKFTSDKELNVLPADLNSDEKMHLAWTIKESVYKLDGLKQLPFKSNILIKTSSRENGQIKCEGLILKGQNSLKFCSISANTSNYYYSKAVFDDSQMTEFQNQYN